MSTPPRDEARLHLQWKSPLFQLKIVVLLLIILTAVGATFYRVALNWELREALLQIVLIISTLGGIMQHEPKNVIADWFNIFFIITILIVALWGVSLVIEATVRGELVYYWGARRMDRRIAQLSNHYIICGFGRMGQEIARQLTRAHKHFVVVEHNPEQIRTLDASEYLYVYGDAREDEHLIKAGVVRAKGLIAVAASDEQNVYITLSARVLNAKLYIVTRCSHENGEAKLLRAGADRVFSPYVIGGRRLAQSVLQPSLVDFLDTVIHGEQMELVMEEITLTKEMPACGKVIAGDADVESLGAHLLGIVTSDGTMLMRGLNTYTVNVGDTIILLGEPTAIHAAVKMLTGRHINLEKLAASLP